MALGGGGVASWHFREGEVEAEGRTGGKQEGRKGGKQERNRRRHSSHCLLCAKPALASCFA